MMSKYSKFGVNTFNTFWVMGYVKFLQNNNDDDLAIAIAQLRQAKKANSNSISRQLT